jgi:cytochrome P450
VRMICRLLNFPESDWERLAAWSDAAVQLPTTAAMTELERIETALRELRAYTTEQIERIRERPGDDLGSRLLAARDEGDSLSPQELVELFESLLMAGAETTKTVLALALWLFMKHADQWAALRADPALVPSAVEEVLRFRILQLGIGRFAREDVEIHGTVIPEGTFVLVAIPAANFDSAVYDDPGRFDIRRFADGGRAPAQSHLTFGFGVHVCVGAHLVRLELQEAFAVLSRRWPDLALDTDDPNDVQWSSPFGVHGPSRLPLRWGLGLEG